MRAGASVVLGALGILSMAPLGAQTELRVATWNMQGIGAPGSIEFQAELAILGRLGADVVAVNEIVSAADHVYFLALAAAAGYPYAVAAPGNPWGDLRNGFLSRWPIFQASAHTSAALSGDPAANDIASLIVVIVVDLPSGTEDLTLVVDHLKHGLADSDAFRRAIEALRIAQAVGHLEGASEGYVVAADMNAEIAAPPGHPVRFLVAPSGLPADFVLGSDLGSMLLGGGIANDPFACLPPNRVVPSAQMDGSEVTHPGSGRRLDYLFVSPAMPLGIGEVYDSADEGLPGGLEKSGAPLASVTSSLASDHLPVFADLTAPPRVRWDVERYGTKQGLAIGPERVFTDQRLPFEDPEGPSLGGRSLLLYRLLDSPTPLYLTRTVSSIRLGR